MNKDQQLEAIKKACIAANPEIVELKFGCEVRLEDYKDFPNAHGTYIGEKWTAGHDAYRTYVLHPDNRLYPIDEKFTTIGRPIRLADVLLAMPSQFMLAHHLSKVEVAGLTHNTVLVSKQLCRIITSWNLRADDLTQQSYETIAFLYELLQGRTPSEEETQKT